MRAFCPPGGHRYDTPLVVRPGDELKMNCEFSSLGRDYTTEDGPGSFNEMCYGFLTYYPASLVDDLDICVQWKDLDMCGVGEMEDCDIGNMFNTSRPDTADMMEQVRGWCWWWWWRWWWCCWWLC